MDDAFPANDKANDRHEVDDISPTAETRRHIPRVLIIDTAAQLSESIRDALEQAHILAFCEHDGARALQLYHQLRPDVVILDLNLPDMTGWQLLDAVKETQTACRRPAILIMTRYNDPANRLMGKLRGVDDYLLKPFSMPEMIQSVQKALAKRGLGSRGGLHA